MVQVLPQHSAAGHVFSFEWFIRFLCDAFINIVGVNTGLINMKALILWLVTIVFIHEEIKIYFMRLINLNQYEIRLKYVGKMI